jgi:hypothetical protein
MLDAIEKAIGVPETVIDECRLEIVIREGDTPIRQGLDDGNRNANLSECWHFVRKTG